MKIQEPAKDIDVVKIVIRLPNPSEFISLIISGVLRMFINIPRLTFFSASFFWLRSIKLTPYLKIMLHPIEKSGASAKLQPSPHQNKTSHKSLPPSSASNS